MSDDKSDKREKEKLLLRIAIAGAIALTLLAAAVTLGLVVDLDYRLAKVEAQLAEASLGETQMPAANTTGSTTQRNQTYEVRHD